MVDANKQAVRIAFVGKKATGKSFVAFYLKYHYHFKRMKLSDGVDSIIRRMYGWDKYKRPNWEHRLKLYDAMYKVDPNIHISYLLNRLQTTTMNVVVEDVRYLNEVEALGKKDFIIVRVTTDDALRQKRIIGMKYAAAGTVVLNEYFNSDLTRPYKADYTIVNTTREATRKSVDALMETLNVKS
jgi:dephospho-CoA kinase